MMLEGTDRHSILAKWEMWFEANPSPPLIHGKKRKSNKSARIISQPIKSPASVKDKLRTKMRNLSLSFYGDHNT